MPQVLNNKTLSGFTLIELLTVIGIISILAVAVVVVINPAELLKQARDSTRITDLRALDSSLNIYQVRVQQDPYYGESETVYTSIPDTSQTCDNVQDLPDLPDGWSYNCVAENNIRNIDGTGWIPVDLTRISFGSPIPRLPLDPVNDFEQGLYYTYIAGSYAVETPLESERERGNHGIIFTMSSSQEPISTIMPGSVRARGINNGVFTDPRDGNEYRLTVIGSGSEQQVWFADNLDFPCNTGWCGYHSSDPGNANGRLYTWTAVMDGSTEEGAQGLCPDGWHIPTDGEFKVMEMFLGMSRDTADSPSWRGGEEGALLKVSGTTDPGWSSETCGSVTCNLTGWNATGGGYRQSNGSFSHWRTVSGWLSSSPSSSVVWRRRLDRDRTDIYRFALSAPPGLSARCLRS